MHPDHFLVLIHTAAGVVPIWSYVRGVTPDIITISKIILGNSSEKEKLKHIYQYTKNEIYYVDFILILHII